MQNECVQFVRLHCAMLDGKLCLDRFRERVTTAMIITLTDLLHQMGTPLSYDLGEHQAIGVRWQTGWLVAMTVHRSRRRKSSLAGEDLASRSLHAVSRYIMKKPQDLVIYVLCFLSYQHNLGKTSSCAEDLSDGQV
uniref:Uncharacterized protein n=1 Tax=Spongospora subterranea TaxID=70186 RepID=A0A0H5R161_9EUKA|eukprot:CRZ01534.1 hypothetical protein [Spongospora subterranea]